MSAYESHLPVLDVVTELLRPKRILELGAGEYSTPFFLSLPIERLDSVEVNKEWREKVKSDYKDDARLHVHASLPLNLNAYDLVFIDDGESALEREASIRWVLSHKPPLTVIHDAEVYATVIDAFTIDYTVIPTTPATAVVWA